MAVVEPSVKSVYTNSYDSFRKERKLLRQWEGFFQDVISGTRKLSDKPVPVLNNGLVHHNRLQLDAVDYPSKAQIVETAQREEMHAYWREMRKEVSKLNKLSLVNQWFGIPVRESTWGQDPANWARYSAKISNPMDLRTVSEKLDGSGSPAQYTSPEQVTADIRLVVSNCEAFNEGDSSDQVCKVARQLQNSWERRWQPDDGTGLWRRWQQMKLRHTAEKRALKWVQAAPTEQIQSRLARFTQMARRFQEEGHKIPDAPIPWETRRKLAIRLSQLNQDHVAHMLQVLEHLQPDALPAPMAGADLMIDIDKLTLKTIDRLQVMNACMVSAEGYFGLVFSRMMKRVSVLVTLFRFFNIVLGQIFLDHLAVHKGKDDKKKRAASKNRERGNSQTAASSPAHTPNTTGMALDTDPFEAMDWDVTALVDNPVQ